MSKKPRPRWYDKDSFVQSYDAYYDYRKTKNEPVSDPHVARIVRDQIVDRAFKAFQAFSEGKQWGRRDDTVYTADGVLYFKRHARTKPVFLARLVSGMIVTKMRQKTTGYDHSPDRGLLDSQGVISVEEVLEIFETWCRSRDIPCVRCNHQSLTDAACAQTILIHTTKGI